MGIVQTRDIKRKVMRKVNESDLEKLCDYFPEVFSKCRDREDEPEPYLVIGDDLFFHGWRFGLNYLENNEGAKPVIIDCLIKLAKLNEINIEIVKADQRIDIKNENNEFVTRYLYVGSIVENLIVGFLDHIELYIKNTGNLKSMNFGYSKEKLLLMLENYK